MMASTTSAPQNSDRFPVGAIVATTSMPPPRRSCITQTQVRSRPKRSTIGLQRNLNVTARWRADVDEIWVSEAWLAVRNSVAI